MIKPTIGRIVLVFDRPGTCDSSQPEPARICYVHGDRSINVAGDNAQGHPFRLTSLLLVQPEDGKAHGCRAEWMPYQKAVANGEIPAVQHATPAEPQTTDAA